MKTIVIALLAVASLGLTTMAQKQLLSRNLPRIATVAANESPSTGLAPFSCTCSCGKSCDGSCSGHYSGCGAEAGLDCIADCCDGAPNPGSGECGGLL